MKIWLFLIGTLALLIAFLAYVSRPAIEPAHAQLLAVNSADCTFPLRFPTAAGGAATATGVGTSELFDNRSAGCTEWTLIYSSFGWPSGSIEVVNSTNNNSAPSAAVAFQGTVFGNNNQGVTQPVAIGSSGVIDVSGYYPYMGVAVTAQTGTGFVTGTLYGWRRNTASILALNNSSVVHDTPAITGFATDYTGTGSTVFTLSATANTVITANTVLVQDLSCYAITGVSQSFNRTDTAGNKFETTTTVAGTGGTYHYSSFAGEKMVGINMWASATNSINCTITGKQ